MTRIRDMDPQDAYDRGYRDGQYALVSLHDMALMRGVQRSTVRMWRLRHPQGQSAHPFPKPVRTFGGVPVWDLPAYIAWLEATGRMPPAVR